MSGSTIAYFGYGSLVNQRTLQTNFISVHPAKLKGWRRHWQARPLLGANMPTNPNPALLSVHRHEDTELEGVIVIDREECLEALDEREAHYDRVKIDLGDISFVAEAPDLSSLKEDHLFVYVGRKNTEMDCENPPPLLQSYLDVVMSGFYHQHGAGSVQRFIDTTIGFDREIILDRKHPVYPRAIEIDPILASRFDELLARAGVIYLR